MGELFTQKPVKIDTLGDFLGQYRRKLNLDIRTVSMLTQIKPAYLESLERGEWNKLPAEVYIKGFLKQLSEVYHLPEEALVEQYQKEHGFEEAPKTEAKRRFRINLHPKIFILGLSAAAVIVLLVYVGLQIRSVLTPPALEILEPADNVSIAGSSVTVSGKTEVGADVLINNQAVLVDRNGQFNENLTLSAGLNVLEIKAVNKFKRENKRILNVSAEIPSDKPIADSEINVVLNIGPEPAWIYLEADGVVVQRGTMLAGSIKTVSAKKEILLTSANAGSTEVIYNGKNLGKLGREGEVVRNVEFSK
ncbi:MAG: hypothetical protein A3H72_02875 [Candidatus Doudnabacteria bacterium RIFCSPLOWO2_02_FULL_48_8]|uniref:Cytoskeleton protein RodZ-like C-terminal domain-containing protein n=1 Tax=Candidatus Doudnabacteria bacterium RIFCSPHIGHO2_01_FULL_46_24 TaxID=1817825 RepID=A0A1F5NVU4_9BACT|nr:MAG: hypothetical protein A2720_00180 [Candidatus Doudnabacteria bacterium RIFCSPHIGHO2_01_FULL_46_24]OGE94928.1 MAG: hypothetical protein A3H72_02875 [Candidatus Doudnabacteria bacterium RIFCSPLOWO2_02_FULL_48_8]OGE95497.1 MAG: hypothetical protein A3E98_01460 [Candidatus Doudnabacteria bacterium RIFCSPHIGHO2_12_FULL_48_11]